MLLYLRLMIGYACAGAPGAMEGNNVNRGDVFLSARKVRLFEVRRARHEHTAPHADDFARAQTDNFF
jgi:hypothetical protein